MAAGATKQTRALASTRDPVTPEAVAAARWLLSCQPAAPRPAIQ